MCNDVSSVAGPGCLSRIPDPTFFHPGSRIRTVSIPDPGSASKNLGVLTPQKKTKKWFLSSRKYDLGCSSRIRMLTFYPSRIPDPGVKRAPDPGSGFATLDVSVRKLGWNCTVYSSQQLTGNVTRTWKETCVRRVLQGCRVTVARKGRLVSTTI